MNETTDRSQTHATFVVERTYPVPVADVWHALSDNEMRDQWFGGGPDFELSEASHEFRVGVGGMQAGHWHGGPSTKFSSTYTDIVEPQRIVYTYDMWLDDRHISTSLGTFVLEPDGDSTRLVYTEQGVHLDGLDTAEQREDGTGEILDSLGAVLTRGR